MNFHSFHFKKLSVTLISPTICRARFILFLNPYENHLRIMSYLEFWFGKKQFLVVNLGGEGSLVSRKFWFSDIQRLSRSHTQLPQLQVSSFSHRKVVLVFLLSLLSRSHNKIF